MKLTRKLNLYLYRVPGSFDSRCLQAVIRTCSRELVWMYVHMLSYIDCGMCVKIVKMVSVITQFIIRSGSN